MRLLIKFFAFFYLFLFSGLVHAETVTINMEEILKADKYYNPSSERSDYDNELSSNIGIQLTPTQTINVSSIPRVILDPPEGSDRSGADTSSASVSAKSNSAPASATGKQANTSASNASRGSKFQNMSTGQAAQSSSLQSPNLNIKQPNGGLTKVGGMIYSDDPKLDPIKADIPASQGQAGDGLSPQAAIAANRNLDTGAGKNQSGSRNVASYGGGGANKFGAIDKSPNPTSKISTGGSGITDKLKALASALGSGAMSLAGSLGLGSGGSSKGSNNGNSLSKRALGANGKFAGSKQLHGIDPNLLKDRYGRYISSSQMVFGAANTKIFENICGHYAAYAAENRIPYNRVGCKGTQ